ncbi:MAG: chloride channel protein [Lachnospiraceae bacterium]|nr:chloride channel protein [Lachnospiraceae bacterium]
MNQKPNSGLYDACRRQGEKVLQFLKWVVVSGIIGIVVGLVGTAFSYGMETVTQLRESHRLLVLGLPIAGLVIVFLYHIAHRDNDHGTNSVLAAIRSEEKLSVVMAPLMFVSTLLTHLFGGSAGREGAALQMGGSIGSGFGKLFRMNETDMHVAVMCSMSACFSALFGTPLAAAIFSIEVVSVGVMYYSALVPCVFASLVAVEVARFLGVTGEAMTISLVPQFTATATWKVALIAILCAVVSICFCMILHGASSKGKKWFPNPYIRILVTGAIIAVIQLLLGTSDYMGAGMEVIERCMHGEVRPEAFLIKMLLTALTLGAGYKGGEIVPSFFIGATFGCTMGQLLGVSPSLCAAVGMIAVFCGVTNSPITSLLIALELFGMEALPFFMIGVAISYMLSGYYSLYDSQRILYSKYKAEFRENKWRKSVDKVDKEDETCR